MRGREAAAGVRTFCAEIFRNALRLVLHLHLCRPCARPHPLGLAAFFILPRASPLGPSGDQWIEASVLFFFFWSAAAPPRSTHCLLHLRLLSRLTPSRFNPEHQRSSLCPSRVTHTPCTRLSCTLRCSSSISRALSHARRSLSRPLDLFSLLRYPDVRGLSLSVYLILQPAPSAPVIVLLRLRVQPRDEKDRGRLTLSSLERNGLEAVPLAPRSTPCSLLRLSTADYAALSFPSRFDTRLDTRTPHRPSSLSLPPLCPSPFLTLRRPSGPPHAPTRPRARSPPDACAFHMHLHAGNPRLSRSRIVR